MQQKRHGKEYAVAAVEAYRSDVVQNVNDFIERNDFSQAIILLKHALRILDGDEELTGMLDKAVKSVMRRMYVMKQ